MNQRMRSIVTVVLLALGAWLAGCGDDVANNAAADEDAACACGHPPDAGMDGGQDVDAAAPEHLVSDLLADAGDDWQSLIQAHWVVPANTETYRCARITPSKDIVCARVSFSQSPRHAS